MSEYIVGADNIDGKEQSYISTVIQKLEAKGHTCQNVGVGPNHMQATGLSASSTGKIGVFIVGGSDIGTYVDFVSMMKRGAYHYKYVWFCFASNTATTDKWITCNGLANTPMVRAHDDNFSSSSSIAPYIGKPAKAYFDANKQYIYYVCGAKGCSFDEIANRLANGDDSDDEGSSASTIKEAIKEVMSAWDGEVEAYVRDMKMYIHKIKLPEQDCNLVLSEGLNIESRSISIKDYCPNNTNKLVVHWNGGDDIVIQDNSRIERFGEKVKELDAIKRVLTDNAAKKDSDSDDESTTDKGYEEVPAETYEEALEFAHLEWNRCKREDCHEIELNTAGGSEWQQGKWVRVYIPSFNIDGYYYISRVSENMNANEWKSSLTLVDYPPSFGEPEEESEEEEETDESEVSSDTTNSS
jgi:hypothetical protein